MIRLEAWRQRLLLLLIRLTGVVRLLCRLGHVDLGYSGSFGEDLPSRRDARDCRASWRLLYRLITVERHARSGASDGWAHQTLCDGLAVAPLERAAAIRRVDERRRTAMSTAPSRHRLAHHARIARTDRSRGGSTMSVGDHSLALSRWRSTALVEIGVSWFCRDRRLDRAVPERIVARVNYASLASRRRRRMTILRNGR